jgi:hypothetical protein
MRIKLDENLPQGRFAKRRAISSRGDADQFPDELSLWKQKAAKNHPAVPTASAACASRPGLTLANAVWSA